MYSMDEIIAYAFEHGFYTAGKDTPVDFLAGQITDPYSNMKSRRVAALGIAAIDQLRQALRSAKAIWLDLQSNPPPENVETPFILLRLLQTDDGSYAPDIDILRLDISLPEPFLWRGQRHNYGREDLAKGFIIFLPVEAIAEKGITL